MVILPTLDELFSYENSGEHSDIRFGGGNTPCIPSPEYAPVKVHKLCSMFRITQIKLSWLKSPSENWLSMCKCLKNRMINIGN